MKLVKIIPKCKRAKNRVKEHGEVMDLLGCNDKDFTVRSLKETFKYRENLVGTWVGTFTEEEADYELL